MDRRAFVRSAACAIPVVSNWSTQPCAATKPRIIGVLTILPPLPPEAATGAWDDMRKFGWTEGRDFIVERRYANGKHELLAPFARDLVRLGVDVILCIGTEAALAARDATTAIPIVIFMVGDPVGSGLVRSLGRPGGNITGYSSAFPELHAKLASLLHELLPTAKRVAVLFNPNNPLFKLDRTESQKIYRGVGLEPIYIEVPLPEEVESAIAESARQGAQGLVVLPDPMLYTHCADILRAAQSHAMPTVAQGKEMSDAGALLALQASHTDQAARSFALIDKIFRGAHPADLPIEQPTKFDLIVNLKAAKALGVTVPYALMIRADEVVR